MGRNGSFLFLLFPSLFLTLRAIFPFVLVMGHPCGQEGCVHICSFASTTYLPLPLFACVCALDQTETGFDGQEQDGSFFVSSCLVFALRAHGRFSFCVGTMGEREDEGGLLVTGEGEEGLRGWG